MCLLAPIFKFVVNFLTIHNFFARSCGVRRERSGQHVSAAYLAHLPLCTLHLLSVMTTRGAGVSGGRRRGGGPMSQTYYSSSRPGRGGGSAFKGGRPFSMEGVYNNEAMVHTITSLTGLVVELTMSDGKVYQGILKAVSPQLDVVLELAHLKTPNSDLLPPLSKVIANLQVKWKDIVFVSSTAGDAVPSGFQDIFKTDTEISGIANGHTSARKLQPFEFDEGGPRVEELEGLEDGKSSSSTWSAEEMLSANKAMFNVGSTYNEEMPEYTTKLEKDKSEDFQLRKERAERLALQIENQDSNRHGINDDGTEEEMFSAVVREVEPAVCQEPAPPTEPVVQENQSSGEQDEEEKEELTGDQPPGEQEEPSAEQEANNGETVQNRAEQAIRSFQLNPHAKEFNPLALASLPAGPSSVSSSNSSSSVGSSPSQSSIPGRPRPFSKSPRNNRGPGGGSGLFTSPPEQPPHSSYIGGGASLMPRPLQSPGQMVSNQYTPVATTLPSPTGVVVRPSSNYPHLVGQVQQQQYSPSLHPSLQQHSAFYLPSAQSHLQAMLAPPMMNYQGQPVFLINPQTGGGGAYQQQQMGGAMPGLQPYPQSQGGGVGK